MSEWKSFYDDLKRMTFKGLKRPGPFLYFISIIVVAGGVGVWLPWLSSGELGSQGLMTYTFALLAAVIADFVTQDEKRNSFSRDFSIFIIALVVLIICITVIALNLCQYSIPVLFISLMLLWWLWWILLEDKKFDIPIDEIEHSTIGSGEGAADSDDTSLAALKAKKRQLKAGENK